MYPERLEGSIKIGVPIGFSIFLETAVFAAVTLLMSSFDTATIAAHQAALNFATTLYMLPLSICMSLTILVGFEAGSGRMKDAWKYAKLGIGTAVILSLITAVVLFMAGRQVAGLYSNEPEVVALIQHFLLFAIFFQISDAIATPTQERCEATKTLTSPLCSPFCRSGSLACPWDTCSPTIPIGKPTATGSG